MVITGGQYQKLSISFFQILCFYFLPLPKFCCDVFIFVPENIWLLILPSGKNVDGCARLLRLPESSPLFFSELKLLVWLASFTLRVNVSAQLCHTVQVECIWMPKPHKGFCLQILVCMCVGVGVLLGMEPRVSCTREGQVLYYWAPSPARDGTKEATKPRKEQKIAYYFIDPESGPVRRVLMSGEKHSSKQEEADGLNLFIRVCAITKAAFPREF